MKTGPGVLPGPLVLCNSPPASAAAGLQRILEGPQEKIHSAPFQGYGQEFAFKSILHCSEFFVTHNLKLLYDKDCLIKFNPYSSLITFCPAFLMTATFFPWFF
jgi:hypothetical protein